MEIEQVPALPALEKRAQLRPEQLLRFERDDVAPCLMPAVCEFERIGLQSENIGVLSRVDLDLQVQLRIRSRFRREAEDEMRRMAGAIPRAVSKPCEPFAH